MALRVANKPHNNIICHTWLNKKIILLIRRKEQYSDLFRRSHTPAEYPRSEKLKDIVSYWEPVFQRAFRQASSSWRLFCSSDTSGKVKTTFFREFRVFVTFC